MNKFELFSLIFYALDAQWDDTPKDVLGEFLSDMNPFLFTDIGSADPACYDDFCKFVNKNNIELKNSYKTAENYIKNLAISDIAEAFAKTDETKWLVAAKKYLSSPHKGQTLHD